MENSLTVSLLVTLIGMAVVFLAMALIYASMQLLTAIAKDKTAAKSGSEPEPFAPSEFESDQTREDDRRLQAAAIAVALERAAREESQMMETDTMHEALTTPWGKFHRQRQLRPSGRGRIA
jgi:Na+-transporting methylmalonyl-CoA/oxaloacetate decarboxylase gamma subunit